MDPLAAALIAAFATAAGSLGQGIADGALQAAGGDAWASLTQRLPKLALLETKARAAVAAAVAVANATLRSTLSDAALADDALALLANDSPEGRAFRTLAVEELVLSARPNMGRLLDQYRRSLRFVVALGGRQPRAWAELAPVLQLFLGTLLPEALAGQKTLRPLLLRQEEVAALDAARAMARASDDAAATLRRIEALLGEIVRAPRYTQYLAAGQNATHVQQLLVQGDYHAASAPPPADVAALFARYRTFLIETYGVLDFRGIMQVQNVVRLPLEEVYVLQRARRAQTVQKALPLPFKDGDTIGTITIQMSKATGAVVTSDFEMSDSFTTTADEAERLFLQRTDLHVQVRDTPFLVVLGDPGTGKSTLVRYVMLALAEGAARQKLGLDDEWLPILLPVAAFAEARDRQPDLAPLDYLASYYKGQSQPDYGALFRRALLSGRALVLLDGLDEVREDRLELVRILEAFVREWDGPGNRFVATSRIAGYDDAPLDDRLFAKTTIEPLDDDGIHQFATNWSRAYERVGTNMNDVAAVATLERRAATHAASLAEAVFATQGVTGLARNPLLLTILALIHNQGTRLPDRRVDLYKLCIEALAETWNRGRSLSNVAINAYLDEQRQKIDERLVVDLLGPAALWVHAEQPGGLVDQTALENQIAATICQADGYPLGKARRLAGDFIQLMRRHTGLLQERGHRLYGFLHLTFEEYLAARALLESVTVTDADERIHLHASDPGWREVLRLAVASRPPREAQRLLLHLLKAPTTPETRGRPAILAGECLLDVGRMPPAVTQAVADALVALIGDGAAPYRTRVEAGFVLGRIGDPRLLNPKTGDAPQGSYWCHVDAGSFWFGDDRKKEPLLQVNLDHAFKIARFPVTNAEYGRFIDDDGYNPDKPWWTDNGRTFLPPGGHPYDDQEQPIALPRLWHDAQYNAPSQPVVGISWYEAAAYCNWLTRQGHTHEWLSPDAAIRLPTALEWERAARHTDQRRYPWGVAAAEPNLANYSETLLGQPSPVGCFPGGAAVCGALDMLGNTCEWLSVRWEEQARLATQKDFTQGDRPTITWTHYDTKKERIFCGARFRYNPYYRRNYVGFRVMWFLDAPV